MGRSGVLRAAVLYCHGLGASSTSGIAVAAKNLVESRQLLFKRFFFFKSLFAAFPFFVSILFVFLFHSIHISLIFVLVRQQRIEIG